MEFCHVAIPPLTLLLQGEEEPAVMLDGIRRRAGVLLIWDGGNSLVDDATHPGDRLAYSLMRDLLAVQA